MKIVFWIILVVLFLWGAIEANGVNYRRIRNRVPILSRNDSKSETILPRMHLCDTKCENSFVFYRHKSDRFACTCISDKKPLERGLINAIDTELFVVLQDADGIRNFLYMDVEPNSDTPSSTQNVPSLEQCSLFCFNSQNCKAFSYTVLNKTCQFYDKGHLTEGGKTLKIRTQSLDRVLYFERLGYYSLLYSPQWSVSLIDPKPLLKIPNNSAEDCAEKCLVTDRCLSFNFFPGNRSCQLLGTSCKAIVPTPDDAGVYFQLLTTQSPISERPLFGVERTFTIPGWPNSLLAGKWEWKFITPWGRSLRVDFLRSKSLPIGNCPWNVTINSQTPFCNGLQNHDGQSNNSVNIVRVVNSETENNTSLILKTKLVWSCNSYSPILLKGPGEIAEPENFESPGEGCTWIIQPPSPTSKVTIHMKINKLLSGDKLRFATRNSQITDCSRITSEKCKNDAVMEFDGNVTVQYTFGGNPLSKFHLSYNFSSETKSNKITVKPINIPLENEEEYEDQLQNYNVVNITYQFQTSTSLGKLRITLLIVKLGDQRSKDCQPGRLLIIDPNSQQRISTCWDTSGSTVFESKGNSLIVQILKSQSNFDPETLPDLQFRFKILQFQDPQIKEYEDNSDGTLTSPNFPLPYNASMRYKWDLWPDHNLSTPVIRFSTLKLAQFTFNDSTYCDNDRLVVDFGGEKNASYCGHHNATSLPIFIGNGNLDIYLTTDDRLEDIGFEAEVKMLKVLLTTNEVVNVENETGIMFCIDNCTWKLTGESDEEYLIELPYDCQAAQYKQPGESSFNTLGCDKAQHVLPTGSLLKYSATQDNFFKALYSLRSKPVLPPTTSRPSTDSNLTPTTTSRPSTDGNLTPTTTSSHDLDNLTTPTSTASTSQETTSSMTQISTSTSPSVTVTTDFNQTTNDTGIAPRPTPRDNRTGAIIGSVLAVVIVGLVAAAIGYFFWRRRSSPGSSRLVEEQGFENPMAQAPSRHMPINETASFDNPLAQNPSQHETNDDTDIRMHEY